MTDLRQAAQQALEALEGADAVDTDMQAAITALKNALEQQSEPSQWRDMVVVSLVREGIDKHKARELADHFAAQQQAEPVSMRMPKVGDKVICLEDESLGEVVSLTGGGSPDITFDDGTRGTYLLREFAELFGYVAAPQQQAEPVAWFDWMPKGATHIAQIKVKTTSGGKLELRTHAFKYDNEVLMVYTTDNDNEYPGWREAKQCFYHLNFPVFPLYTTPPQRPWVGLTDEETVAAIDPSFPFKFNLAMIAFVRDIEAKLKERNT